MAETPLANKVFGRRGQSTSGILSVLLGGLVAVTLITLLWTGMLNESQNSYPVLTYDEDAYGAFNQSSEIMDVTEDLNDQFTNLNSTGTGVGDIMSVTTTGGYNSIRLFASMPALYYNIINSAAQLFGIPSTVVDVVVVIIIGALIGLFILLVFRVVIT